MNSCTGKDEVLILVSKTKLRSILGGNESAKPHSIKVKRGHNII